jgi:hypothetical protein
VKFRFPRRRASRRDKQLANAAVLGAELARVLRERPMTVKLEHVYGARPPLPKPARMMIAWQMQTGIEYKTYVPMYGQRESVISWPQWLYPDRDPQNWPPVLIRFEFEYDAR